MPSLIALLACVFSLWSAADEKPERFLFERASAVYQVFAQIRKPARPTRGLASAPILIRNGSIGSDFGASPIASKIQSTLRLGIVLPDDNLLPNGPSHGTQDVSKE